MMLEELLENIISLDEGSVFLAVFSRDEVIDLIKKLNTQNQLFDKGINSKGIDLGAIGGDYSDFTVEEKKEKGLPFDRVTLFDTGEFYDSFVVMVSESEIVISANPIKDDTNLFTEWGSDIVGLTDDSKSILIEKAKPEVIDEIRKSLF